MLKRVGLMRKVDAMFDPSNLTPAPWYIGENGEHWYVLDNPITTDSEGRIAKMLGDGDRADATFIALARNAFGVMWRRGWGVVQFPSGWTIAIKETTMTSTMEKFRGMRWSDPFTALVSADEWYREHVETESRP